MRFTPQTRRLAWLLERPIAHRGLHDARKGIIENTHGAFEAAVEGNYAIECDLQITADGEAVIFHDETLDRLTDTKGWVNQHTVRQLQNIKIANSKDRIQTLAQLLEQVNGKVPLVIELKSHWNGNTVIAERALKVLEPYAGAHALMSFDPDLVAAVVEMSPLTIRGITADRAIDPYYNILPVSRRVGLRNFAHLHRTRPHFVSFSFRELPFAPVQQIRDLGHPVITWTIRNKNEEAQARRYSDQITFEGYAA